MPDQMIQCVDCQVEFNFSERDQEFYTAKSFSPPKRCKPCRDIKKQSRERQDQQRG